MLEWCWPLQHAHLIGVTQIVYLEAHKTSPWFQKIDPMQIIGMRVCVCVSAPEAIHN